MYLLLLVSLSANFYTSATLKKPADVCAKWIIIIMIPLLGPDLQGLRDHMVYNTREVPSFVILSTAGDYKTSYMLCYLMRPNVAVNRSLPTG